MFEVFTEAEAAGGIDNPFLDTVATVTSDMENKNAFSEAFSYELSNSTMTGLGDLQDPIIGSDAQGISKDGTTITGEARDPILGQVAYRYTTATGMVSLGRLEEGQTVGLAVSANGSVIVGRGTVTAPDFTNNTSRAFIWTENLGLQDHSTAALWNLDRPSCYRLPQASRLRHPAGSNRDPGSALQLLLCGRARPHDHS